MFLIKDITIKAICLILLSVAFSCSSSIRFSGSVGNQANPTKSISKGSCAPHETKKNNDNNKNNNINNSVSPKAIGDFRANIIKSAKAKCGVPYCYGGDGISDCYDCSGFVCAVFNENGFSLPRVAAEQSTILTPINKSKALPGDLVFFKEKNRISHVGIYLGDDSFIHASSSKGVSLGSLQDAYYVKTFAGFGKIPNNNINLGEK